ncbi:1-hydroxycarotenoid 3,4-desaturase CrtD [Belnapia rosea]|uniref:1-hydroxycarotenoid 3,4-desaturase n=1 Tax=Belnapia rosea TaxID=938405 RepID=A0A1G6YHK8_9PROT|nr:1-hydroxycarotenoid 3,4-desaturase CrtD [Belnapia rosea]SDD89207.1 1-hydroxycarotenoid 3,4-desaturase [Belnapia rosea]
MASTTIYTGHRVVVIGAGVAGLATAVLLAARGLEVTVLERAVAPGGKMREVAAGTARMDGGPTVFTMRWVFEELFAEAGAALGDHLALRPVSVLARHAWSERERLDLFADTEQSAEAIGRFAGAAEARGYRDFCERARKIYRTLEGPFIRAARPTPLSLAAGAGLRGLTDMWGVSPFATLWAELGRHFRDPRLRQLFGRYATYCGSSPFLAPATLMLVAHVEQAGVWLVEGGMHRLALAMARLAEAHGARFRYGAEVAEIEARGGRVSGVVLAGGERIAADAVVANADLAALAGGLLGDAARRAVPKPAPERSLSAMTWCLEAGTSGFPLARHNVFFSADYAAEFRDIFERERLPGEPTVYVCAQDRDDAGAGPDGPERLLVLTNAPAIGDRRPFTGEEIASCERASFDLLRRCGLRVDRRPEAVTLTTPLGFERLFPATGGALYGRSLHGWSSSFGRPGAATRLPGLFLAGGSVHPGPGVPMAAMSGRLAAAQLLGHLASAARSGRTAMPGGMSTR